MTRRLLMAWAAAVVTYAVLLVLTLGLVVTVLDGTALAMVGGGVVIVLPVALVPGVTAAAVAVHVLLRGTDERPSRWCGLAAVSVPALVVLAVYLRFLLAPPVPVTYTLRTWSLATVAPVLVLLLAGAGVGVRAHARWAPRSARSSYLEVP